MVDISIMNLIELKTERLIIRNLKEEDFRDYLKFTTIAGIPEAAGWVHHKEGDSTKTEAFFKRERFIEAYGIPKRLGIVFNDHLIGTFSINISDNTGWIGYCLNPDYWFQGFATEACKACVKWLLETRKDLKIRSMTFVNNLRSQRVLEKASFRLIRESHLDKENLLNPYENRHVFIYELERKRENAV